MTTYRPLALALAPSLFASITLISGCNADGDSTAADPPIDHVSSALVANSSCPSTSLRTEQRGWYQMKATRSASFVLGGTDPRKADPLLNDGDSDPANPYCAEAYQCLDRIRRDIIAGVATVSPTLPGQACEMPAGVFTIDYAHRPDAKTAAMIEACSVKQDKCWDTGVSGFFFVRPDKLGDKATTLTLEVDPQPAQAVAKLSGSSGASAAAIYVNTLVDTTVVKWPSGYTPGSLAPAGAPCSNVDLLEGTETVKIIQIIGSSRRCY